MFNIGKKELKILKGLNTPQKIQDFLNKMRFNFEERGETNLSPMAVLEKKTCHCIEGAALAALAFRLKGYPPLLVDLRANRIDLDHVIAVFKKDGKWGAISKTNHAVLRYREPIYKSVRELAMSYFHEYTDSKGRKNLRSYSRPVNLKIFDKRNWMTTKEDVDYLPKYMDKVKHFPVLSRKQIRNLRIAEKIEIKAGNIIEWKKIRKRKKPKAAGKKQDNLFRR